MLARVLRHGGTIDRHAAMAALIQTEAGREEVTQRARSGDPLAALFTFAVAAQSKHADLGEVRAYLETAARGDYPLASFSLATLRLAEAKSNDDVDEAVADMYRALTQIPGMLSSYPAHYRAWVGRSLAMARATEIRHEGLRITDEAVRGSSGREPATILANAASPDELDFWLERWAEELEMSQEVLCLVFLQVLTSEGFKDDLRAHLCNTLRRRFDLPLHSALVLELDRRGLWCGPVPEPLQPPFPGPLPLAVVLDRVVRLVHDAPADDPRWTEASALLAAIDPAVVEREFTRRLWGALLTACPEADLVFALLAHHGLAGLDDAPRVEGVFARKAREAGLAIPDWLGNPQGALGALG